MEQKRLRALFVCSLFAAIAAAQSQQVVRNASAPNDGTTGTVVNQLAKLNGSGNAIRAATTDTGIPLYVVLANAGTTGTASLAVPGMTATCQADASGITIGHWVILSAATNGRCADAGTTPPSAAWVATAITGAAANANATVLIVGSGIPGANGAAGSGYAATSTTSLAVATGSTSFSTQSGLAYSVGARARASSAAGPTNYMEGIVTSYSGTTLVINVDTAGGSGTHADWNINLAGNVGAVGPTGPAGPTGNGTFTNVNDGTTGTTTNLLAKINSSGNAIKAGTSDTAVPVFVCISGCGTTASATLAVVGSATCQMDAGGATIGHFIVESTATAGRCMDTGASTPPGSGWVIGVAQTTAAANANATIVLFQGYNAATSGAGLGVGAITGTTTMTYPRADTGCSGGPCNVFTFTLTASSNVTASSPATNPAGMTAGQHYTVIITEPVGGGVTIGSSAGPSNFEKFPGVALPTDANAVTTYNCVWTGSVCKWINTTTTANYGASSAVTFSTLPSSCPASATAASWISDSTVARIGDTVAGSGSNLVYAICPAGGSSWFVAASAAPISATTIAKPIWLTSVAGTNTITGTLTPAPSSYGAGGLLVEFLPANNNTGAATVNWSSIGAVSITKCGTTALASGDLTTTATALLQYDGTRFQLLNPQAAACGGGGGGGPANTFSSNGGEWNPVGGFAYCVTCGVSLVITANTLYLWETVAAPGGTPSNLISWYANGAGHFNWALYDASCTTKIYDNGVGTAGNGGTSFTPIAFTPTLVAGTTYWLAFSSDTSSTSLVEQDSSSNANVGLFFNSLTGSGVKKMGTGANTVNWSTPTAPVFPSTCGAITTVNTQGRPVVLMVH